MTITALGFGQAPDTLTRPGEWAQHAACAGQLDAMYPPKPDKAGWADALAVCDGCPVRAACLDDALAHEGTRSHTDRYGVIGGHTPYQRWRLAKERGIRAQKRRYVVRDAA